MPNAKGCPPADTTMGIIGINGPCVPGRLAPGRKKPDTNKIDAAAIKSS